MGGDKNPMMVTMARGNAKRAGLGESVPFVVKNVLDLKPPFEKVGLLIVNPPYGERMGSEDQLKEFFYQWGKSLKANFKGWTLWVLSSNEELTRQLNMKSSKRVPVSNGPLECQFLRYEIR